jgi:chorismate synthase
VTRLRWTTAGESHGPELTAIVEGIPAGLSLLAEQLDVDLARRQRGYGRGARMKIETDRARITAGVRGGETLGGPIAITILNRDHANWAGRMGAAPFDAPPEAVTRPRPGHADLAGGQKYDRHDLRDILERASARETAARVAVGGICKRFLAEFGVDIVSHVVGIGPITAVAIDLDVAAIRNSVAASEVGCANPAFEEPMRAAIRDAAHAGDTLGGEIEIIAVGLPPGLGSHVSWDRKLDGRLAQALMSVQAIKAVAIGAGFAVARLPGSEVHDAIELDPENGGFRRKTNRAGGLEGGMTNGMPLVARAAMKPIATLRRPLGSVDILNKQANDAAFERSDVCAVPAAAVVCESMVAIVLAEAALEKFGGDSLYETRRNFASYREQLGRY